MQTYQRIAFVKGGADLSTRNVAHPHNFLIVNYETNTIKIGSTGARYNDLPVIVNDTKTPVSRDDTITDVLLDTEIKSNDEVTWPTKKKKTTRKKKLIQADDSETPSG